MVMALFVETGAMKTLDIIRTMGVVDIAEIDMETAVMVMAVIMAETLDLVADNVSVETSTEDIDLSTGFIKNKL